jgi:hypothetical protein
MEQIGTVQDFNLPVTVYRATVIHSNKYSRAEGTISYFVFSTLYTEVVFRFAETNEDRPYQIRGLDLPLYTGEEVMLVCVGNIIIGYIDVKSNRYYYMTENLRYSLGLGMAPYWIWIGAILVFGLLYILQKPDFTPWIILPFVIAYIFLRLQRIVLNYRLKKGIDRVLAG